MAKPTVTVFVLRDPYGRLSLGLRQTSRTPQQEYLVDGERHTFRLRPDVHRGHAAACALLVIDEHGVDGNVRLAVVHARREGVHHFVVVVDQRIPDERADAFERTVRELLADLDLAADTVPVLRAPLRSGAPGSAAAQAAAVPRILAALDELPFVCEPAPLHSTPPAFVDEAAVLDILAPLYLPATLVHRVSTQYVATTTRLGGSYHGGAPHLAPDERWPDCPRCRVPLAGLLQIDTRDFRHQPPPAHGLFVLFVCPSDGCDAYEIRHHASPTTRSEAPPAGKIRATDFPRMLRPETRCWQLPSPEVFVAEHPDLAARLCELLGDSDPVETFSFYASLVGADTMQFRAHLGGHVETEADDDPAPTCTRCGHPCLLVVQSAANNREHALWACREHPEVSFYRRPV